MAEIKDAIRRIIKTYIGVIAKNNINIEKMYLFGSYARGTAVDDSDINIAIISDDFSGDRFADRRRVVPLRRSIDRRLEPIPYRPENFKENDPLVVEILKNGIE
ncbi:MAG: nucleotidyltransferase domain-containing protein, partial [Candidatus Aminicenantes bacterium]|nr:nucleotidyltransferase domain-containing protein [Candidatus Aminicenantes bacterium]NIN17255.1 nucleotidyltransferase domain-containing protein [Candidatus Aminicenantes bacterium]NIQ65811.1 nucleotidyltransferase domain-containing protein [Candidatus Aminicenantes bacterium]NIR04647.1 nucleotidyltransferase domain-containing protein [Candidatus Aminicenantes bacterium]